MKKLVAALCFMFALSPLALAQPQDAGKKGAPAEKAAKSTEKPAKAKKEPSEKQKAQQQKMKTCNEQASNKKLKGDERKKFVSTCMKG